MIIIKYKLDIKIYKKKDKSTWVLTINKKILIGSMGHMSSEIVQFYTVNQKNKTS